MATHVDFYVLYLAEVGALHFINVIFGRMRYIPLICLIVFFVLCAETVLIFIFNRFFPELGGKKQKQKRS